VLCKGYNDGEQLDATIAELARLTAQGEGHSLSVVPVGLTLYREGLTPLEPLDALDCAQVIEQVHAWQNKLLNERGSRFVFLADEFYIKAKADIPHADEYEDFPQIDNGVGMLASLRDAARNGELGIRDGWTVATGVAAAPFLRELLPGVNVIAVQNNFYGEHITVAGLLTGQDIADQLAGRNLGKGVLLPACCLRDGEDIFLDNVTVDELATRLGVKVEMI